MSIPDDQLEYLEKKIRQIVREELDKEKKGEYIYYTEMDDHPVPRVMLWTEEGFRHACIHNGGNWGIGIIQRWYKTGTVMSKDMIWDYVPEEWTE